MRTKVALANFLRFAATIIIAAFCLTTTFQSRAADATATSSMDWDEAQSPLDDAIWRGVPTHLLAQRAPVPNAPTAFATTAQFLVSPHHLYVRVACFDPKFDDAVAHSLIFDGDQSFDDHITLVLDTFDKHRTAYEFDVNRAGSRTDGLISPAATLTSYDWNGDWRAKVTTSPDGWIAYFAIDVRSLQFPHDGKAWGMNIARYVPRSQLSLQWSGISLDSSVTDLSREGTLNGMDRLAPSAGVTFSPYALASYSNITHRSEQTGFDVRYDISPEVAAIVTVNPDFAEAEVDAQQINLTPYTLFKPEKRAFFLEGANLFTFASGIGSIFVPFYSRTIGLVDGTAVKIDEGVKVVAQSGPWSAAALGVRAGDSPVSAATDLFVGRATYDIDEHLRVGTLVTDGNPTGGPANTFEGVDAVWRTANWLGDKNLNISGWAARTKDDSTSGNHSGFGTYIDAPNDLWRGVISANQFGDALNPAMGFLPRPGTRQYDLYFGYFPRPTSDAWRWVRQFFYETELERVDDLHGHTESQKLTLTPFNILTEAAEHLEFHISPQYERLNAPFAITPNVVLPAGEFEFNRAHFQAESSSAGAWQVGAQIETGGFYDGKLTQWIPYAKWTTPDNRWHFEFSNETDCATLREGRFIQRLHQIKASYSFDNDLAFSSFTQYDSDTRRFGSNAQLRWIIAPGRDLFVVFNHSVVTPLADVTPWRAPLDNTLTIKLQWTLHR